MSAAELSAEADRLVMELRVAGLEAAASRLPRSFAAWVRYGARPIGPDEVALAAARYRVAILQPWETDALAALKAQRPDMVVLCYKCLSSTRRDEPPGRTSAGGVPWGEAEAAGERWFAHRRGSTERVEWEGYPGHFQMAVWEPSYRRHWIDNVLREATAAPWDGVFADNDVYDDYYGLGPLDEVADMATVRAALDLFVSEAGQALNAQRRLFVPNIAESRREPGRWARHGRFGGGYEENWLGWQPGVHFDEATCDEQASELFGPGITVVRVNARRGDEDAFRYGVAAFWALGGGRGWACTASEPDEFDALPFVAEQAFDLGRPLGPPLRVDGARAQVFTDGWAAVNLGDAPVRLEVPPELFDAAGRAAPDATVCRAKEGRLYASRRALVAASHPARPAPLLSLDTTPGAPTGWFALRGGASLRAGALRLPVRHDYGGCVVSRPFVPAGVLARTRLDEAAWGPSAEMLLELRDRDGDGCSIGKSGGALLVRRVRSGERLDETAPFDVVEHRWWGIEVTDDVVRWLTSADGVSWDLRHELFSAAVAVTPVALVLVAGHFEPDGADEEAVFGVLDALAARDGGPGRDHGRLGELVPSALG